MQRGVRRARAVRRTVLAAGRAATRQVAADLRRDPYLVYILALALVLAGFRVWHLLPNVATRDERWRVVDPLEAVGAVAADPGVESLREGVLHWRPYGATFYLYGLALVPLVAFAALEGRLDAVVAVSRHAPPAYWDYWNGAPAWFWTAAVLSARLVNVALAVGCVYVLYRLGTEVRDRATGRTAALLLSLTWGLVVLAHEAGEDVPALFCFLLAVLFAFRYVEGSSRAFYAACAWGGLAVGFKLTAGMVVIPIGAAHLLRARRAQAGWRGAVLRPRLVATGAALGAATVLASYPSVLVGGPGELVERLARGVYEKGTPHGWVIAPSWWWILRGYLHGVGLGMFVGLVAGVAASLSRLRDRSPADDGVVLALSGVAAFLGVYATWAYVRAHHLLPTIPLLILVLAVGLGRLSERRPTLARAALAFLVVTSGTYAGVGDLGYAGQPRERAADWLAANAGNATVETYVFDPQDAAVPHGMAVSHPGDRRMRVGGRVRNLSVVAWVRAMPRRCPAYVQLNYQFGVLAAAPANHSRRAELLAIPALTAYFRGLLAGEYPYEVAAEFGPRPAFLGGRGGSRDLVWAGIDPRTVQYGDPQDFGVKQYTVILRRTGACHPHQSSTNTSPSRSTTS